MARNYDYVRLEYPDAYLMQYAVEGNWAWRELYQRGLIDFTEADAGEAPKGS
jgi:hypothetical protein